SRDDGRSLPSRVYLGSQPIKVDATGYWSIEVSSSSNWNGSNIINGDASHTWNTTFINFNNAFDPVTHFFVPVTYDLTSNTLSHVNIDVDDQVTLQINNTDTADVQYGGSGKLVTAESTLDLSHATVAERLSLTSTNALGTAFTVGDLG